MTYTRDTIKLPSELLLPSNKKIDEMYVPNMIISKTNLATEYYTKINAKTAYKYAPFISSSTYSENAATYLYMPKSVLYEICQNKSILSEEFKNNFLLESKTNHIVDTIDMPDIEEDIFLSVLGRKIDISNCRIFKVLNVCNKYNLSSMIKYIIDNLNILEFCIVCEYDRLNCYRHLNRDFFTELCKNATFKCVIEPNKYCNPITHDSACSVHEYDRSTGRTLLIPSDKQMLVKHDHRTIIKKNVFRNQKLLNLELLDNLKNTIKYKTISQLLEMYTLYLGEIHANPGECITFNLDLFNFLLKIRPLLIYYSHMNDILDIE